jgi:hypothetical protein
LKRIARKTLKILAWVLASILFLILLVLVLIQIPAVQNFAKDKAVSYLQKKIKTKVSIGELHIAFPKQIVLQNVFFEDQKKDTLLYGKELRVDIAMLKLLRSNISVDYLELNGIRTNIYRLKPDTVFNFDYIVKAFAGTSSSAEKSADTSSSFTFNLGKIVLKNVSADFKDDASGNDVFLKIKKFETKIDKFDLDKYFFSINNIRLNGFTTFIHQYKPLLTLAEMPDTTATAAMPKIQLGNIALQSVLFKYINDEAALNTNVQLGDVKIQPGNIDLQTMNIAVKDLSLNNSTVSVAMGKSNAKTPAANDTSTTPFNISLDALSLNNTQVSFDDSTQPQLKKGLDYFHLHLNNISLNAKKINASATAYGGTINHFSFREQSGFALKQLTTDFYYSDTAAYAKKLLLQTNASLLRDNIMIKYPSIESLADKPGELFIDANLNHSFVNTNDILLIAPFLSAYITPATKSTLQINTRVNGYVKNLSIPFLQANGFSNTAINISGNIKGLPNTKDIFASLNIAELKTSAADIYKLIPPKTIPSNIRIPSYLSAKGYFKGGIKTFATQLQLTSSNGSALV